MDIPCKFSINCRQNKFPSNEYRIVWWASALWRNIRALIWCFVCKILRSNERGIETRWKERKPEKASEFIFMVKNAVSVKGILFVLN